MTISDRSVVTGVWRSYSDTKGQIQFTGTAPGTVEIEISDKRGISSTIRLTVVK